MKPKKYVLSGGPGSGKSSILLGLEQRGEYIVREAAEDYIRYRQAQGQMKPWVEEDFQDKILDLSMSREEKTHPKAERVFLDRGLLDGLAYVKKGSKIYEKLLEIAKKAEYDIIFIIEPLAVIEKTEVRRENKDESIAIGNALKQIYQEHGFKVVMVPEDKLQERIEFIMKEIEKEKLK